MNGKIVRNFLIIYLIILLVVILIQLPKEDLSADEPSYKVEIEDDELDKAIIMSVNSPVVFVGSQQRVIDTSDVDVVPKLINNTAYVPIQFFRNILGSAVSWDGVKKTTTVRYNNKAVIFTNNSKYIKVVDNDTDKTVEAENGPIILRERMYVPLRISLEAFNKYIIYRNGLIVISDNEFEIEDSAAEQLQSKMTNLPVVGSENNLKIILGKPLSQSETTFDKVEKSATTSASVQFTHYSKADEQIGDVIKTDGEYIYYVRNNSVVIVKAYPPESMSIISTVMPLEKYYGENCDMTSISEIYVNGNQLILVGNTQLTRDFTEYETVSEETTSESTDISVSIQPDNTYGNFSATFTDIYDISDKSEPVLKKQIISEGHYVSSRLTDNSIYVVSKENTDILSYNNKYIPPVFYDSSVDKMPRNLDFSNICYIPGNILRNYMTITGADLSDTDKEASVYTTIACGDDIYMSENNLYVAAGGNDTEIFKYSLNKGNVSYYSHGKVGGSINNQFSMDENNGYFRIITTENGNNGKSNSLYILDDKLDKVSELKNIADGESIYSAEFIENRAYMVPFETTDPLLIIDISDPNESKILGSLKIPDYSEYLYPYDENHLMGIGKDTIVYEDSTYYEGIKLSMFDVTDVENSFEMFTETIGDIGTNSEFFYNYETFLFDKEKNVIGFPVSIFTVEKEAENLDYETFDFQGFLRYSVDFENGFTQESRTTHFTDEDMPKENNVDEEKQIKRGILIGDYLYTFSDNKIMAESLESEKTMGYVVFK